MNSHRLRQICCHPKLLVLGLNESASPDESNKDDVDLDLMMDALSLNNSPPAKIDLVTPPPHTHTHTQNTIGLKYKCYMNDHIVLMCRMISLRYFSRTLWALRLMQWWLRLPESLPCQTTHLKNGEFVIFFISVSYNYTVFCSVVVSQWTKMLDIVGHQLTLGGISCTRIDGTWVCVYVCVQLGSLLVWYWLPQYIVLAGLIQERDWTGLSSSTHRTSVPL